MLFYYNITHLSDSGFVIDKLLSPFDGMEHVFGNHPREVFFYITIPGYLDRWCVSCISTKFSPKITKHVKSLCCCTSDLFHVFPDEDSLSRQHKFFLENVFRLISDKSILMLISLKVLFKEISSDIIPNFLKKIHIFYKL